MSRQSQRGGRDATTAVPPEFEYGASPAAQGLVPDIVASLACGLRAVYEARPDADIPEAFADLLVRMEAAERARG